MYWGFHTAKCNAYFHNKSFLPCCSIKQYLRMVLPVNRWSTKFQQMTTLQGGDKGCRTGNWKWAEWAALHYSINSATSYVPTRYLYCVISGAESIAFNKATSTMECRPEMSASVATTTPMTTGWPTNLCATATALLTPPSNVVAAAKWTYIWWNS